MIRTFQKNAAGRDFICSDIHGHFSLLEMQLKCMHFNPTVDRLFSLGDLIDRGDESNLALEWLQKPWFYAIQGNHERMLINTLDQKSESLWRQWMMWGGSWAEDLDFDALRPFYDAFVELPIAIELMLPDDRTVGLVHAELPDECDWHTVKDLLQNMAPKQVEATLTTSDMLWKKSQPHLTPEAATRIKPVLNIDHVFHGHTIVDDYLTITNRTFMDLGSYHSGLIGLVEPLYFLE